MKILERTLAVAALALMCMPAFAQDQQGQKEEKPKTLDEKCEEEADRLQRVLNLEDWQTFYVDSILKSDWKILQDEYDRMRQQKIDNYSIYLEAQDRCFDRLDAAYRKLFTDEQWAAYLKQGAAKDQKARAKRRAQAEKK